MGFQSQVNLYPAPGVEGARASNNPVSTVVAGPGGLVSGESAGLRVGTFAWQSGLTALNHNYAGAVPDGFVDNEQQGLITTWRAESDQVVPIGLPVTLYDRGDFWAVSTYQDASIGQKVFANVFNGKIITAATGSFIVDPAGTSGTITASFATNVMTVTAGSVYIAPGMLVTGTGIPANTYIEAQLTGSAGACSAATYSLSTYPGTVASAATVVVTSPGGTGGASASSASASISDNTLTINTLTNGSIAAGSLVKGTGIPTGTYVASIGTFNGSTGTVILSANTTATITTAAVAFSAWIETPWYVKSAGNVHDLIKIGVRN